MTTHVLYLHGFRSSPQSTKARNLTEWMAAHRADVHWWCPQLPPSPAEALQLLRDGVKDWPADTSAVVGSSLGGFYATVLAEQLGWRCAVINPAVEPARDLAKYIGEQTAWHDPAERFFFRPEYVAQLRDLRPAALTHPGRYAAWIATGDEVLDWREMRDRYAQSQLHVIEGSDHALSDFAVHRPALLRFLQLTP